jgi:hypothetical protein
MSKIRLSPLIEIRCFFIEKVMILKFLLWYMDGNEKDNRFRQITRGQRAPGFDSTKSHHGQMIRN